MRTTRADKRNTIWLWAVALVVIAAVPLPAQTAVDLPRLTVSATAGFAHPFDNQFSDYFGRAQMPLSVQMEYRLIWHIIAFSAFRHLSARGHTAIEQASFAEEPYPLRFRMYSGKFGGSIREQMGKITLHAGAGISSNWYKEEVEVVNLSVTGRNTGFLVQATASYPLRWRFSLLGQFEFSSIPSRPDPETGKKINLGGIEIAAGLLIRLF